MVTNNIKIIPSFHGNGAGTRFENLVQFDLDRCALAKVACGGRYGVQVVPIKNKAHDPDDPDSSAVTFQPIKSLPDFEGVLGSGRQFMFDCKVVSGASLPLSKYDMTRGERRRQLNHMLKRSRFNALCGFLIHFNARKTQRIDELAVTYLFPVIHDHTFWTRFDAGIKRTINREDCEQIAIRVCWPVRNGLLMPDIGGAVTSLARVVDSKTYSRQ